MTKDDLKHRFTYHAPKEGQPLMYENIRNLAHHLAILVEDLCPHGREKSLAVAKIEEAVFWANAAIARGPNADKA